MNEQDFGTRMKPWLDRSAAEVGEMQATRLRAARLRAMDRFQEPVRLLGLVTVGAGTAETIRYSVVQRALLWLPVLALLTALAFQSALFGSSCVILHSSEAIAPWINGQPNGPSL